MRAQKKGERGREKRRSKVEEAAKTKPKARLAQLVQLAIDKSSRQANVQRIAAIGERCRPHSVRPGLSGATSEAKISGKLRVGPVGWLGRK